MLATHYDPKIVESDKYEKWIKEGYFKAGLDKSKPPFSLVIPPPNVTGKLHLGHVMDTIPDDIIARYKRLKGYDVLWVPGTDHAGIATQAKVEAKLAQEHISKYDLGREGFLNEVWKWKEEYSNSIHLQWAKLGLSVDYTRERFTLDEGLSKAVKKVFVTLYNEGLIYQSEKIINWDPSLETALSNIEVIHQDDKGEFYYFYYDVVDSPKKIIVATTRPETMFGDVAIFVNPKDKRYTDLIDKYVINPANGQKLKIYGDRYVDMNFGTGAMKCTPAHDINDFNLAKKYNLPIIKIMDKKACMNENCPLEFQHLSRYECRKRIVEKIKNENHLYKIEEIIHSVGHSERSGDVVEPMLSKQWFVKMKPLAAKLLEVQESDKKIEFYPKRFANVLKKWMENVEDWCISRQLWWGHQIPAYYNKKTGEILVSEKAPDLNEYQQDEDVLDTWFSSALWPFSTLGWPNLESEDYKRYFPTDILVTGYDIIFFWVARMSFQSLHFTNSIPFKKVLIHGLVRDEKGKKMSKSSNNGVDPIDVINKYGVDALRYFITTNSTPGMDIRYSETKLQSSQAYLNKIWNAARFVEMNLGSDFKYDECYLTKDKLNVLDKAILHSLNQVIKKVSRAMEKFEFGQASTILYNFVYDDFCSFYLETSKVSLTDKSLVTKNVLYKVMKDIILMIYPYTPFISEEMYLSFAPSKKSIMLETYPTYDKKYNFPSSYAKGEILKQMIKDVRNYKSENNLSPNQKVKLEISPKELFPNFETYLSRFAFASKIEIKDNLSFTNFYYPKYEMKIDEDIPSELLIQKLKQELAKLEFEIKRSSTMLNNPNFVKKAPIEKVKEEQEKLKINLANKEKLEQKLKNL